MSPEREREGELDLTPIRKWGHLDTCIDSSAILSIRHVERESELEANMHGISICFIS